ncbi:MAG TPA: heterodisulfide reductase-related iron-sulfur binding cluster [Acidobacteriota bacterium]|nr:heterodisulfide reductase-related iron-sulfur binding cluster [Acidobacteriota bacterium]
MLHQIDIRKYGPQAENMAEQVKTCVHCGFCLPACPTYRVLGEEMDSPRGRIVLMKGVLEESIAAQEALPYLDSCLGCLACVPACPSGVRYQELITPFRALPGVRASRSVGDRLRLWLAEMVLPYPKRFYAATALGICLKGMANFAPGSISSLLTLLPDRLPKKRELPETQPAVGKRRARVALLIGCVQEVLNPEITDACLEVLSRNGVEVVIPRNQSCCGALSLHSGAAVQARALAGNNLGAFPRDIDCIITTAAGCGSGMKEYPLLFKGQAEEERAREFSSRVRDVAVFLDDLGLADAPPALSRPWRVAYHDACHLLHAQGIREAPRRLLRSIPNLDLLDPPDSETCCGSAGTYNLQQPVMAGQLGEQKARNILATGAEALAAGNIGCLVQIRAHLAALGHPLPVYHPVQILALAYCSS